MIVARYAGALHSYNTLQPTLRHFNSFFFNQYQSLYPVHPSIQRFCKMFILHFLIALLSTAIASPLAGEFIGLADHLSTDDFSLNGFSQSAERSKKETTHLFMNDNDDEALSWQYPPGNLVSTDAIPENIAGAGGKKVEKEVQKPEDQGDMFQNFDCANSNGVCCMGNPLIANRAAQPCEQSIQLCSILFHYARLMVVPRSIYF